MPVWGQESYTYYCNTNYDDYDSYSYDSRRRYSYSSYSYDSRRRYYGGGRRLLDSQTAEDTQLDAPATDLGICTGTRTLTHPGLQAEAQSKCSANCCPSNPAYKCCGYTINTWGGGGSLDCDCNSAVKGGAFSLIAALAVVTAMQLARA